MHLRARSFKFKVLSMAFVVHYPHAPSSSRELWQASRTETSGSLGSAIARSIAAHFAHSRMQSTQLQQRTLPSPTPNKEAAGSGTAGNMDALFKRLQEKHTSAEGLPLSAQALLDQLRADIANWKKPNSGTRRLLSTTSFGKSLASKYRRPPDMRGVMDEHYQNFLKWLVFEYKLSLDDQSRVVTPATPYCD